MFHADVGNMCPSVLFFCECHDHHDVKHWTSSLTVCSSVKKISNSAALTCYFYFAACYSDVCTNIVPHAYSVRYLVLVQFFSTIMFRVCFVLLTFFVYKTFHWFLLHLYWLLVNWLL